MDFAFSLCSRAWKPIEYDSRVDSPETIENIRAANRARETFCN